MSLRRGLATAGGVACGFVAGSVAGFVVASEFDDALFGWHDTIGPEIGFALVCGLTGALVGAAAGYRFRPHGGAR